MSRFASTYQFVEQVGDKYAYTKAAQMDSTTSFSILYNTLCALIFQRLMSKLLTDMPEDPLTYLFEKLKQENDDCMYIQIEKVINTHEMNIF